MYKCVIFDVDGTLFDTSEGIYKCINYVLEENGYLKLDEENLKKFIGPPVLESFQKYCKLEKSIAEEMTQLYRKYYVEKFIQDSIMYAGMKKLLDMLKEKDIKIAIATLKTQEQIDVLLQNQGLKEYFDCVYGASEDRKNKKSLILLIGESLQIENMKEMVLVGDSLYDAQGAEAAGVDFIGVTYGFGLNSEKSLEGSKYVNVCDNISELIRFFVEDVDEEN